MGNSLMLKLIYILSVLFLLVSKNVSAEDRLKLDGVSIIGNDEMPSVLYVPPWKRLNKRISTGIPVNSLINVQLEPIERQMFLRRLKYFSMGE
jgi:hypothetical protein